MKKTGVKLIISLVMLAITLMLIRFLNPTHTAEGDGTIHLVILDQDEIIVFDDNLIFYEEDTFFDILDRAFDLTCANASYQPDETCSHTFGGFAYQGKVILGIKNSEFELMTDWYQTFLAFEVEIDDDYVLATQGPSQLTFEDGTSFRISIRQAWE